MKGLLTSLITVLTFTGLQAQSLPAAPKLVVGLTIDQLRTDYLEAFSSLYGEKGFKRLWKEGRVFHNAEYTFCGIDRASAIAAIYSGTTPSMNGIISGMSGCKKCGIAIRCNGIYESFALCRYFKLVGNG